MLGTRHVLLVIVSAIPLVIAIVIIIVSIMMLLLLRSIRINILLLLLNFFKRRLLIWIVNWATYQSQRVQIPMIRGFWWFQKP